MSQVIDRFHLLAEEFAERIESTPADAWTSPSPCAGWTARDVVEHVVGGVGGVVASATGRTPDPITPQTDLAAAWRDVQRSLTTALGDPAIAATPIQGPTGREMSLEQIVNDLGSVELMVHTWDLARAVGGDERLDPDLVREAYDRMRPMDGMIRSPGGFGPKRQAPAGADLQTEFLCFLGREV